MNTEALIITILIENDRLHMLLIQSYQVNDELRKWIEVSITNNSICYYF